MVRKLEAVLNSGVLFFVLVAFLAMAGSASATMRSGTNVVLTFGEPPTGTSFDFSAGTYTTSEIDEDIYYHDDYDLIADAGIKDQGTDSFESYTTITLADMTSSISNPTANHTYGLLTTEGHYAKVYVVAVNTTEIKIDWAYQNDGTNNFPVAANLVVNNTDNCTGGDAYYTTITAAVEASASGGNITVCPGAYTDNVYISGITDLSILSFSQDPSNTSVTAADSSSHVFDISSEVGLAGGILIAGFSITGTTTGGVDSGWSAIAVLDQGEAHIRNNIIYGNGIGIEIMYEGEGVSDNADNNTIENNTITANTKEGIKLDQSSYNNITNNIINGNAIHGIELHFSNNNSITSNIIDSITGIGIEVDGSNNRIYNNLFRNQQNSFFPYAGSSNFWNTTKTNGTNIVGGPWMGGNFWGKPSGSGPGFSNTCPDNNADMICDTTKTLDAQNIDFLPLTKDSDGDGVIDGSDDCHNTPPGETVGDNGCPEGHYQMEDSDGDGMDDMFENDFRCLDSTNSSDATTDYDGDGFSNIDEFYGYSDPCFAESIPTGGIGPPPEFGMDDYSWFKEGPNTNITFNGSNLNITVWNGSEYLFVNGTLNNTLLCNDTFPGSPDYIYHFEAEILNSSNAKIGGMGGGITNITNKSAPIQVGTDILVKSPRGKGAQLPFTQYGALLGVGPSFDGNITINVSSIPPAQTCANVDDFYITGGNLTGYTDINECFGIDFVAKRFDFGGHVTCDPNLLDSSDMANWGADIKFGDGMTFQGGYPDYMPPGAILPNGSTVGNMEYFGKITGGYGGFFGGDFIGDGGHFDPYITMYNGSKIYNNVTIGQNVTFGNYTEIGNFTEIGPLVTFDPFVFVGWYADIMAGARIKENASIGFGAYIGNNSVVGKLVNISDNATIGMSVRIYDDAEIGKYTFIDNFAEIFNDTILGENVTLGQYAKIKDNATIGDGSIIGNKSSVDVGSEVYEGRLYDFVSVGPNVILNKTEAWNSTINYTLNAVNFSGQEVFLNMTIIDSSGYITNNPGVNGSIHLTEGNVKVNFTNLNELRDLSDISVHDLIADTNTSNFSAVINGSKLNITKDGVTQEYDANAGIITIFNDTSMGIDVGMNFSDNTSANMDVAAIAINPGGVALPSKAPGTSYTHLYAPGANESNMNARLCMKFPSNLQTSTVDIHYFNETSGAWEEYTTEIVGDKACANTTHFSVYGISGSVPDDGNGNGGGGGGAAPAATDKTTDATEITPTEADVVAQIEATFTSLSAGKKATISIPSVASMPFSEIAINIKNAVTNVKVVVKALTARPTDITAEITGEVFNYLNIEHSNIEDADIDNVTIKFKVEKSWISDNNIDSVTVVLNRYSGGAWISLTTSKTSEDTTYVYYSALSPGLSVFGISGSVATVPTPTVTPTPTAVPISEAPATTTVPPTTTSAPTTTLPPLHGEEPIPTTPGVTPMPTPAPKPVYKQTWFIVLVLIALVAIVVYLLDRQGKVDVRAELEKLRGKSEPEEKEEREEVEEPEETPVEGEG